MAASPRSLGLSLVPEESARQFAETLFAPLMNARHTLLTGVSTLTILLAFPLFGAETISPNASLKVPASTEIFSTLRREHPRLIATEDDFTQLKIRVGTEPKLRTWHAKLKEEGEQLLSAPLSKYEIPDGLRLLATSRRVMQRTYTLAMLCRLNGDRKYADRAWAELEAAAGFPDWNPKHFLDTAEMTHAFAIGYDWLYDFWTPEQRAILKEAIITKGLKPAQAIYNPPHGWARAHHNWNQVCNGGIGMGALALAEVEPSLCGEILRSAIDSLPLAMREFAPDGAWNEGPGYWAYATMYNVVFLAGLHSALGTDFGLSDIPGFSLTGLFPLYIGGPIGKTFNYADGGDHAIRGPQIFWFGRRFNQPVLDWYESQTSSPAALDLLWYTGRGKSPNSTALPLDKYFRAAEVVTMRSDWEDPQALFVGFKAGDNKANHSHLDLGCFVFDALGVRWATDLGADNYNMPGYFGGQRWNYYRLRAEGQNTLVLNPSAEPDQDPKAATRIERFESNPSRVFAIADLTAAYKKNATSAKRGLALLDRNALLIQDEVRAEKPADLWWFMHTATDIHVHSDGKAATLKQRNATLEARILTPREGRFTVMDAKPLPSAPHPEGQSANQGVKKLVVHLENVESQTLAILLSPETGRSQRSTPEVKPLSDW